MTIRKAEARWEGDLMSGKGHVKTESGALDAPYSFKTRMENEKGTNPEELIGAAHAGCFTMALCARLTQAGMKPTRIDTTAEVQFDKVEGGFTISSIRLRTRAAIPGVDASAFKAHADEAKRTCPVSRALAGTKIELDAALEG